LVPSTIPSAGIMCIRPCPAIWHFSFFDFHVS
jgi:hypothetical protein